MATSKTTKTSSASRARKRASSTSPRRSRPRSTDAITMLKRDHEEVARLFKSFEKLSEGATKRRRQIVDKVIEALSAHAAIEEQVFYPHVRRSMPDATPEVLEALEEHHIVKWTLSELEDMDPTDER